MNKKEIQKIKLFATGIKSRHEESKEFFVGLDAEFFSGRKKQTATFVEKLYYNKEYLELDFVQALDFLVEESIKYDAMNLIYKERGGILTIMADGKDVKIKKQEQPDEINVQSRSERDYYIKASKAQNLLREIGIMTGDGKIKNDKIRKYNQIDHFIEVVDPIVQALPKDRSITLLDCACGKSYLTFVLNHYLVEVLKRKCHIIGVDYNSQVIESSIERSKRLGYQNMEFVQADLNSFEPSRKIDLLVSLHACDNATDFAIATGVRLNVPAMIVVPCCHKEFIEQLDNEMMAPIFRHNIFKA